VHIGEGAPTVVLHTSCLLIPAQTLMINTSGYSAANSSFSCL